jgi:hypothetical protein
MQVKYTALATAKDPKKQCNRYLWNYRDKRYAYGYPIDTNSYCFVKTAAVGGTG